MRFIQDLVAAHGGRCTYCCTELTYELGLAHTATVDHRIPRSRGGTYDRNNLVAACHRCNQAKGAMSEAEFREYLSSVDA